MKPFRVLVAVLILTLLGGCFGGGSGVTRIYYSLQPPLKVKLAPHRYGTRVVVRPFSVAIAYRRQEMVYRTNPYQFSYYNYRLWAARPDKLLTSVVGNYLRLAGLFGEITQEVGDALPDYELFGEVLAMEELDSTEQKWFGRLSMRIVLRTYEDRKAVWEHSFDRKAPVVARDPIYVVKAINQLLVEEMDRMVIGLDRRLAALGHEVLETHAASKPGVTPTDAPEPGEDPGTLPRRPRARLIE